MPILRLKCTKFDFGWGQRSPRPPSWIKGPTSKGEVGREGRGKVGRGGKGGERSGEEGKGKVVPPQC